MTIRRGHTWPSADLELGRVSVTSTKPFPQLCTGVTTSFMTLTLLYTSSKNWSNILEFYFQIIMGGTYMNENHYKPNILVIRDVVTPI